MSKTTMPRAEIQEFLKSHPDRWISTVALSEVFDIDWGFIDRGMTDLDNYHRREFTVNIVYGNPDGHEPQRRLFLCYTEQNPDSIAPPRTAAS